MNTFLVDMKDEFNCKNQKLLSHCQKCGRRNRKHKSYTNNSSIKYDGHLLKNKRYSRLFPNVLPSYSQTYDSNLISKNFLNQNTSRKSSQTNILIDQLIQVQQINSSLCNSLNNDYQILTDIKNNQNSFQFEPLQQMIYLRENINK